MGLYIVYLMRKSYMLLTVCDREPEREQEALELMEKHIRQFDKLYGRNF